MQTIEVLHKPYNHYRNTTVTIDMVDKVYYGRLDCCACGCQGDYYENTRPENGGQALRLHMHEQDKVDSAFGLLAEGRSYDIESIDDYIFDIPTKRTKKGVFGVRVYLYEKYSNDVAKRLAEDVSQDQGHVD